MLAAHKVPWFGKLFTRLCTRMLRRQFAGVRVLGLPTLQQALAQGPVLLMANHVSYWDAIMIVWLTNAVLRSDGYAWMDGHNLRRLSFFRWLGAFGVHTAVDAAVATRYAGGLLQRPGQHVWMFPQGREWPYSRRPLQFRGGSAHLMRRCPQARAVPVALRYEFGETAKPWVHVAFGAPHTGPHQTAAHEQAVLTVLQQQEADVHAPNDAAQIFLASAPLRLGWPTRLLSWLAHGLMHASTQINVQRPRPPSHPAPAQDAAPGHQQQRIGGEAT